MQVVSTVIFWLSQQVTSDCQWNSNWHRVTQCEKAIIKKSAPFFHHWSFLASSSICLPPSRLLTMRSSESEVDRIRRNEYNTSVETLIVDLALDFEHAPVNLSIVGLAPALRRLKAIQFYGAALTSQQICELSEGAADCKTLEKIAFPRSKSTDDFKAICQLCLRFPSLKRVSQLAHGREDLREEDRFTAVLEMLKTSKTIEQIFKFRCRNAEEEAAIKYHCRNNMIHNRIREKVFLAANVHHSAWPLILKELSDMPDVLYYLLQQKHGAMIGPSTRQGCKC